MSAVYAEAFAPVNSGKKDEAIRHLEQWDLICRKLQVGEYIRSFGVTPEQAKTADELREALEEVRDLLRANLSEQAKTLFKKDVKEKYDACKAAYPQ